MMWDRQVDNFVDIRPFPGCCALTVVAGLPHGDEEGRCWDFLCRTLNRGNNQVFTLSSRTQQKMIDLVDACPHIKHIGSVKSNHGDYLVHIYLVEIDNDLC